MTNQVSPLEVTQNTILYAIVSILKKGNWVSLIGTLIQKRNWNRLIKFCFKDNGSKISSIKEIGLNLSKKGAGLNYFKKLKAYPKR